MERSWSKMADLALTHSSRSGFRWSAGALGRRDAIEGLLLILFFGVQLIPRLSASPESPEAKALFDDLVLPTLEARCYECHSAESDRIKGGLLLDRRVGLRQGGDSGPAIVPGKPTESLLIEAIRHEGLRMPPKGGPLSAKEVAGFRRWVELGAPDPRDQPMEDFSPVTDGEQGRKHWAFQPIGSLDSSIPSGAQGGRTLDGYIQRSLTEKGLARSSRASRRDLVRRLSFDVTGLPPSEGERARFLEDPSPGAYVALVDRLLASPQFGERQSLFWLDVVRFAESEGFEYDRTLLGAWRYRDYVIDAFNRDKRYDRFVLEQVAGDELTIPTHESLSAAVFHRLGTVRRNAGNPEIALSRNEVLTERTDVIGAAFLGLTLACARCHDHKFDPVSQRDYYQLQAYLAATAEGNVELASPEEQEEWTRQSEAIESEISRLQARKSTLKGEALEAVSQQLRRLAARRPEALPKIPSIKNDYANVTPIHLLRRGDWERKGEPVRMKPLDVLGGERVTGAPLDTRNPRTRLARWLTRDAHPLTARVIVNRIWQQYFGVGLVATANDFGKNGEVPSHPGLLDFLAAEIIRHDWHLKPIHRMILLSETYRQSSRLEPSALAVKTDPGNRLQWRHTKRRLLGEEMRDNMLSVAAVLHDDLGGESVMLPVEEDLVKLLYKPSQWQVSQTPGSHFRRSVYLIAKRNLRLPFMEAFDQPALLTSCFRRESSTHAPQALELLNGRISNELSEAFARRIRSSAGGDVEGQVRVAYRYALGRDPNRSEYELGVPFIREHSLEEFALAMFNLNEFLYVF